MTLLTQVYETLLLEKTRESIKAAQQNFVDSIKPSESIPLVGLITQSQDIMSNPVARNILNKANKCINQGAGSDASNKVKVSIAQTQLRNIDSALELYKIDNEAYPKVGQGLKALVSSSNSKAYLPKIPVDPWGNDYQYSSQADAKYFLYSFGRDGKKGGSGLDVDIGIDLIQ